MALQKRNNSRC